MTFQHSHRPNGAAFWMLLGGLLLAAACSRKPEPEQLRRAVEKASPTPTEHPSEGETEEESEDEDEAPGSAAADTAAKDSAITNLPAGIDPARIPVEEDFESDAEQQITTNSNLERELARIAREIKGNPAQAAERKAEKN